MKVTPLLDLEMAKQNGTHRIDFSYKDIPAGVANNTSSALSTSLALPAGCNVIGKRLVLITPFKDADDAALNTTTISVGDSGSATRFFSAVEGNVNGTEVLDSVGSTSQLYAVANSLIITLGSMTAKSVSNVDVGQAYVLIEVQGENRAAIIDGAKP